MDFNNTEEQKAWFEEQIAKAPDGIAKKKLQEAYSNFMSQYKGLSTADKMGSLSDSLLDPSSKFYQQYASYLQKTTPGIGTNTLLAPLMAGGTGYAGGQAIASKKATGFARERQDKINTGVQGFALGNINMGANLLGQQGQLGLGYANLAEQKRQYDDQNSGWDQFFKLLGMGTGLLSGSSGGGSAGGVGGYGEGAANIPFFSDISVKENLKPIGRKNGLNIYEFNYIGNPKRYTGVIAQEVEKIYPDAVIEEDGIKKVIYSKIGIEMTEV